MTLPNRLNWRKSSYSDQKDCVEVSLDPDEVWVRDTKDREGGQLAVPLDSWRALMSAVTQGKI